MVNDILQTMLETTKNLERFADFNPGRLAEYEVQGFSLIQRDRQSAIGILASLHAEQFKLSPATAHQTAAIFVVVLINSFLNL